MSQKARFLFGMMPVMNNRRRYDDFFINQILAEHGCFPINENKFFGESLDCDCGLDKGTVRHLVYGCPNFDDIKNEYFPENFLSLCLLAGFGS
ncbi:hypothetical protein AVEN_245809-1 [Araneus ventricosus]|uniref:Uncharacterized protein n=1 Tax=Araneus ventricosus TaxID=182803 RepID=A0A4Y2E9D2_ARAVE|nr:hypothetical protein AVEN_245809-1 [Araneus ventricosus]